MRSITLALALSLLAGGAARGDVLDIQYQAFFARVKKHAAEGTDDKFRDLCVCTVPASAHARSPPST